LLTLHVCTTLSDPNTRLCVSGYYFSSGNNHHTFYLALHERIVISARKPVIIIDFFRGNSPYIEAIAGILTHISPRLFPSTYFPIHYLLNTTTFASRLKLVTRRKLYLVGPLLSPQCRCRRLLLQLITLGRAPLDEGSANRRDPYLTTHNTRKREIAMPSA